MVSIGNATPVAMSKALQQTLQEGGETRRQQEMELDRSEWGR